MCASISPGSRVRSPRSITSAPAGCLTEVPTSTMRSPRTRISPGLMMRPPLMSSRRAACSTMGWAWLGGGVCAAAPAARKQGQKNKSVPNTLFRIAIWPAMVSPRIDGCQTAVSHLVIGITAGCARAHTRKGARSAKLTSSGYERLWGPEQSKARGDRSDSLLRVPRDCHARFRFAEGGRSGARLGKHGRFRSDRHLFDRLVDSGMARDDFPLYARAHLFRSVHLQR